MQQYPQVNAPQPHIPTTIFCSQCGTQNFYTAKFCVRRGKRFDSKLDQKNYSSSPLSPNIGNAPYPSFTLAILFFTLGFVCYMFALLGVHELFTTTSAGPLSTIEDINSISLDITIFFISSVVGQAFVSLGFISLVIYISKK